MWWVRAAAAEARSQVAASQMMIKLIKVFILFIHLFIIQFYFCTAPGAINISVVFNAAIVMCAAVLAQQLFGAVVYQYFAYQDLGGLVSKLASAFLAVA